MKKILSIALIALLVAGTAFADFTGSATVGLGYNTEDKSYGFSNTTETKVTFEATTETAGKDAEGSVYAGIKASFEMKMDDVKKEGKASWSVTPKIDEAYIKGEDWTVSILGTLDSQDFAASSVDKPYDAVKDAYLGSTVAVGITKAPGLNAEYKGWKVSGGFAKGEYVSTAASELYYFYGYEKDATTGLAIESPDWIDGDPSANAPENFVVLDKVQASTSTPAVKSDVVNYSATFATPDFKFDDFSVAFGAAVGNVKKYANLGLSAKAAYNNEEISASVASDFVIGNIGADKVAFDMDIVANFAIDPISAEVFYATAAKTANKVLAPKASSSVENLLSAKIAADLNSFDVPVTVEVYGKDIINSQVFGISAKATIDALTLDANFPMVLRTKPMLLVDLLLMHSMHSQ